MDGQPAAPASTVSRAVVTSMLAMLELISAERVIPAFDVWLNLCYNLGIAVPKTHPASQRMCALILDRAASSVLRCGELTEVAHVLRVLLTFRQQSQSRAHLDGATTNAASGTRVGPRPMEVLVLNAELALLRCGDPLRLVVSALRAHTQSKLHISGGARVDPSHARALRRSVAALTTCRALVDAFFSERVAVALRNAASAADAAGEQARERAAESSTAGARRTLSGSSGESSRYDASPDAVATARAAAAADAVKAELQDRLPPPATTPWWWNISRPWISPLADPADAETFTRETSHVFTYFDQLMAHMNSAGQIVQDLVRERMQARAAREPTGVHSSVAHMRAAWVQFLADGMFMVSRSGGLRQDTAFPGIPFSEAHNAPLAAPASDDGASGVPPGDADWMERLSSETQANLSPLYPDAPDDDWGVQPFWRVLMLVDPCDIATRAASNAARAMGLAGEVRLDPTELSTHADLLHFARAAWMTRLVELCELSLNNMDLNAFRAGLRSVVARVERSLPSPELYAALSIPESDRAPPRRAGPSGGAARVADGTPAEASRKRARFAIDGAPTGGGSAAVALDEDPGPTAGREARTPASTAARPPVAHSPARGAATPSSVAAQTAVTMPGKRSLQEAVDEAAQRGAEKARHDRDERARVSAYAMSQIPDDIAGLSDVEILDEDYQSNRAATQAIMEVDRGHGTPASRARSTGAGASPAARTPALISHNALQRYADREPPAIGPAPSLAAAPPTRPAGTTGDEDMYMLVAEGTSGECMELPNVTMKSRARAEADLRQKAARTGISIARFRMEYTGRAPAPSPRSNERDASPARAQASVITNLADVRPIMPPAEVIASALSAPPSRRRRSVGTAPASARAITQPAAAPPAASRTTHIPQSPAADDVSDFASEFGDSDLSRTRKSGTGKTGRAPKQTRMRWIPEEEDELIQLVKAQMPKVPLRNIPVAGLKWAQIVAASTILRSRDRSNVDVKDKWRTLKRYWETNGFYPDE